MASQAPGGPLGGKKQSSVAPINVYRAFERREQAEEEESGSEDGNEASLYVLRDPVCDSNRCSPRLHRLRRLIRTKLIKKWWFDAFIMVCIACNTATLVMSDPLAEPDPFFESLDTVFLIVFTVEASLKLFAQGMVKLEVERSQVADHVQAALAAPAVTPATAELAARKSRRVAPAANAEARDRFCKAASVVAALDAAADEDLGDDEKGGIVRKNVAPLRLAAAAAEEEHNLGYFQSGWNVLDFIIVVSAYLEFIPSFSGQGSSAIRTLRVLRPLRTVNKLRGLKVIINTLIDSVNSLTQVLFLVMFLWLIYGIVGVQLFKGVLRQRCFDEAHLVMERPVHADEFSNDDYCSLEGPGGVKTCSMTGANATCLPLAANPWEGTMSFDNLGVALLNIYIVVSLANWVEMMHAIQDAWGDMAWLYFVSLILLCSFFSMNLVLVVIVGQYEKAAAKEDEAAIIASAAVLKQEGKRAHVDDANALMRAVFRVIYGADVDMAALQGDDGRSAYPCWVCCCWHVGGGPRGWLGCLGRGHMTEEQLKRVAARQGYTPSPYLRHWSQRRVLRWWFERRDPVEVAADEAQRLVDAGSLQSGADAPPKEHVLDKLVSMAPRQPAAAVAARRAPPTPRSRRSSDAAGTVVSVAAAAEAVNVVRALKAAGERRRLRRASVRRDLLHNSVASTQLLVQQAASLLRSAPELRDLPGQQLVAAGEGRALAVDSIVATRLARNHGLVAAMVPQASTVEISFESTVGALFNEKKRTPNGGRQRRQSAFSPSSGPAGGDAGGKSPGTPGADATGPAANAGVPDQAPRFEREVLSPGRPAKPKRPRGPREPDSLIPPAVKDLRRVPTLPKAAEEERVDGANTLDGFLSRLATDPIMHGLRVADVKRAAYRLEEAAIARAYKMVVEADRRILDLSDWLLGKPRVFFWLNHLVEHWLFGSVIMVAIVANTVVLAMDHHGISEAATSSLETANFMLTMVFTAEMVFKIGGIGWAEYASDGFNLFDAVIVVMSLVELLTMTDGGGGGVVSVFRAFRLLRLVKLAKNIRSLRILLQTVIRSLPEILWMSLLMCLFILIFAILGRQLFAGKFQALDDPPFWRFDSFTYSVFAVFQVLTADDWPLVMASSTLATGSYASTLYFVILQMFGMYVILSLFIAILLAKFAAVTDGKLDEEDLQALALKLRKEQLGCPAKLGDIHEIPDRRDVVEAVLLELSRREQAKTARGRSTRKARSADSSRVDMVGTSLDMFPTDSETRQTIFKIVTDWRFEVAIVVLILVNCVLLAMDNPSVDPASTVGRLLRIADPVFTFIFTVEMVLKIIAFGLLTKTHGYLSNTWNVLDGFVVTASILALIFPGLTVFRALRALRPTRVVVRSRKIRVVVQALFYALPNIANVFGLTILFWLIFSILGVSLFKGRFAECSDPAVEWEHLCVTGWYDTDSLTTVLGNGTAEAPIAFYNASGTATPAAGDPLAATWVPSTATYAEREWVAYDANFDNVGSAALTLFQVATLSAWSEVADVAIRAREEGQAPGPPGTGSPGRLFFFILFIIVGAFFSLNLFISVVLDNFDRLKKELDGSAFLTAEQQSMRNANRLISVVEGSLQPVPEPPRWALPRAAFAVATYRGWMDQVILVCIVLNTLFMCLEHYGQSDTLTAVLDGSNTAFSFIFGAEAVVKIMAFGWWTYWADGWNKFDFIVAVLSFVDMAAGGATGVGASVVRIFRIFRVLRLIKRAKTLKKLFTTLVGSLPSLYNIGSFLFVLFYIFAVLGVSLFGTIPYGSTEDEGINRSANFSNFGHALLVLWRMSTSEAWEGIMYATMGHVSPTVGIGFFVAFQLFVSFVLVQLFIAVILEQFSKSGNEEHEARHITSWALVFNQFDPLASRYVPALCFAQLMREAPRPFGFEAPRLSRVQALRRLAKLQIPVVERPASAVVWAGRAAQHLRNLNVRTGVIHPLTLKPLTAEEAEERRQALADPWANFMRMARRMREEANATASALPRQAANRRIRGGHSPRAPGSRGSKVTPQGVRRIKSESRFRADPGSPSPASTPTGGKGKGLGGKLFRAAARNKAQTPEQVEERHRQLMAKTGTVRGRLICVQFNSALSCLSARVLGIDMRAAAGVTPGLRPKDEVDRVASSAEASPRDRSTPTGASAAAGAAGDEEEGSLLHHPPELVDKHGNTVWYIHQYFAVHIIESHPSPRKAAGEAWRA